MCNLDDEASFGAILSLMKRRASVLAAVGLVAVSFACSKKPTDTVPANVLQAICKHEPCGGNQSMVNVYRNSKGEVAKLYRLYGACSHSPGLYFEPNGTLVDTIPEAAIAAGSPEALALQARHDKQVKGLTFTDVIRCSDGMRLPPN